MTESMLAGMFSEVLSDAEVKAIARNRGFPDGSSLSRQAVKNFFLTPRGVAEMFATLTPQELALFHMLVKEPGPVDISFFERLYHAPDFDLKTTINLSYNQRYRGVLKETRDRLVRKGLLLVAPESTGQGRRLYALQFALPAEFERHLPALIQPAEFPGEAGAIDDEQVRRKILEVTSEKRPELPAGKSEARLSLVNGSLMWGQHSFTGLRFLEWQMSAWRESLGARRAYDGSAVSPEAAVIAITQEVKAEEWFEPAQLAPGLEVMTFGLKAAPVEQVLEEGWQWGLLARLKRDGKLYYSPRLPVGRPGIKSVLYYPLDRMLRLDGIKAWVDLETVAPAILADLNLMARFSLDKKRLVFEPDAAKITRAYSELEGSAVLRWLCEHIPAFAEAIHSVGARWGKTVLHQGLIVIRVKDFSLQMQIEREFQPGRDYVSLGGGWLAVRQGLQAEIEKMVKKAEFVVKRVKAR